MTNNFLPKIKSKNTWCWKILCDMFLTWSVVSWEDYCDSKNWRPFVWYNANARLSELKGLWFVEKVWVRENKINWWQPMFLYKITKEWIEKAKILLNS